MQPITKISGLKCIRAHVYKDKGELFIDYWGVDRGNPQIKVHIPRMSLDVLDLRVEQMYTPFNGIATIDKYCIATDDTKTIFEIIIDGKKKEGGAAK